MKLASPRRWARASDFAKAALFLALLPAALPVHPARAADDQLIERLVACKDSWTDWKKNNAPELKTFGEHFQADFTRNESDPFFVPKSHATVAGLKLLRVFPDSVGMGVGFSVDVAAGFDEARARFEKLLGKAVDKCETGDGMRSCELDIAEQRTFTLMAADDAKSSETLAGCYYFYEK